MKPLLVFDMDGVLAEVTGSYRASIVETVRHFTGVEIDNQRIQDYKNQGGWNNDWALSQKICSDLGVEVGYQTVVDYFCQVFFGTNNDGLILRETWIPENGLLERLSQKYQLSIFTGRMREELKPTLQRFAPSIQFSPVVTADDVLNGKPAPDGLFDIRAQVPGAGIVYVGDTVDDARSALAANVPFIGIASLGSPKREELVATLEASGAIAVIADVNSIEEVLPA